MHIAPLYHPLSIVYISLKVLTHEMIVTKCMLSGFPFESRYASCDLNLNSGLWCDRCIRSERGQKRGETRHGEQWRDEEWGGEG